MWVKRLCVALVILPCSSMLSHTLTKTWNFSSRVRVSDWAQLLMILSICVLDVIIVVKIMEWGEISRQEIQLHRPSATHWHILRSRHFVGVVTSNLSTISNTWFPLILSSEHGDCAVGLQTICFPGNTLLKTLDTLVSDECLREEVNDGDVGCELHVVPCFDSLNIHAFRVLCHRCGH